MAPLIVIVIYAFTNGQGQFTLENLTGFFTDPNTMGTLFYSLAIAFVTTVVCLLLAYPIAYILAMSELKTKSVIIMVFVLPMWINFSLRITALKEVLTLIEGNLARYPFTNAVVGITYDFLPFMILPISFRSTPRFPSWTARCAKRLWIWARTICTHSCR